MSIWRFYFPFITSGKKQISEFLLSCFFTFSHSALCVSLHTAKRSWSNSRWVLIQSFILVRFFISSNIHFLVFLANDSLDSCYKREAFKYFSDLLFYFWKSKVIFLKKNVKVDSSDYAVAKTDTCQGKAVEQTVK